MMMTVPRPHSASVTILGMSLQRRRLALRVAAPVRGDQHQADQAQAEQQSRQDAGQEQVGHGDGAARRQ